MDHRPSHAGSAGETERYRTLLAINNAIISNLTREALFHATAEALRRVVPFDRSAIFLHDPPRNVLRLFLLETTLPSTYFLELDRDLLPAQPSGGESGPPPAVPQSPGLAAMLEEVERSHILAALKQAGGVIEGPKGAARILKLHANTLRSRMEKLGIKRAGHESS